MPTCLAITFVPEADQERLGGQSGYSGGQFHSAAIALRHQFLSWLGSKNASCKTEAQVIEVSPRVVFAADR